MRYKIVLVHGTRFFWMRIPGWYSKWTGENSKFRGGLQEHLDGPVSFSEFRWCGANSHRARVKAAAGLARRIGNVPIDADEAQFVVAHSHGGAVALLACHDETVQDRVRGIACLATPFIIITPRPAGRAWSAVLPNVGMLLGGLGLMGTLFVLALTLLHGQAPVGALIAGVFAMIFLVGAWFGLVEWLGDPGKPTTLPERIRIPLLSLRISGDEASAALHVFRFGGRLIELVWSGLARSVAWIDQLPQRLSGRAVTLVAIVAVVQGVAGGALLLASWIFGLSREAFESLAAWLFAASLALLSPAILFVPVVVWSMFGGLAFGWDLAVRLAAYDIDVEKVPNCRHEAVEFEASKTPWLRHTEILKHARCAPELAAWIRETTLAGGRDVTG
jgi:hypothetical protein